MNVVAASSYNLHLHALAVDVPNLGNTNNGGEVISDVGLVLHI